ncbi:MAG: SPOR domain-containing protein [candidate division WOR-3 bacterium]
MGTYLLLALIINSTSTKEKFKKASQMRDPLKASEYYREIIKEDPKSPYADSSLFRIGMLYYILNDFERASEHLELIFKKGESSPLYQKACYWLSFCYKNKGDTVKARKIKKLLPKESFEDEEEILKNKEEGKEVFPQGFYTVQLGAYEDKKWLEYFIEKLKEKEVEYFIKEISGYSKIYSGKFETKEEAEKYLETLKNKGFYGFVSFDTNP